VNDSTGRPTSVNLTLVGRSYAPAETSRVSAAKIAERELGYDDVVAPPTFAVVVAQRAEQAYIADPESGIDFSRVVHAEERFTHHRPIVAGDLLRTTVHVDSVTERAGIAMVSTRAEIADDAGAPVATVRSTLAVRGEGR
jgi:acyl dehydratase